MFKINLVPEVKQEQIKIRKINLTVTTIAIGVGIVILAVTLILLSYIFGRSAQLSIINKDTEKIEGELVVYKDLEKTVLNLENGLRDIKQVLAGGPKWSKFFVELEKVTPGDIQIENLSVQEGKITMGLKGKEIQSIDRFIKSYSTYKTEEKNLFANVVVNGYNYNNNSVNFQATMDLVSGVLW